MSLRGCNAHGVVTAGECTAVQARSILRRQEAHANGLIVANQRLGQRKTAVCAWFRLALKEAV